MRRPAYMPLLRSSGSHPSGFYKYIGPPDLGRLPAFLRFYKYIGPPDLGRLPAFLRFYKYIGPPDLGRLPAFLRFYKYIGPPDLGRQNRCARASTNMIPVLRTWPRQNRCGGNSSV